jgi:hypothetical protein
MHHGLTASDAFPNAMSFTSIQQVAMSIDGLIADICVYCPMLVQVSLTRVHSVSHSGSARRVRVLLQAGDDDDDATMMHACVCVCT